MTANSCQYQLCDCNFNYPHSPCLHEINLQLHSGRFYGLIGPNGSGKTTLVNLLAEIAKPSSGEIKLRGKNISTYSKSELAKCISLVPQSFSMEFEFTVFDIVMMGRHPYIPRFGNPQPEDIHIVLNSLELLDIQRLKNRFVTRLSGGERQRVLVARALAQNTPIMLLDEATASLDIKHSIDIMRVLRKRVTENNTLVLAAIHDLDLAAAFCDELLVLNNGKIVTTGSVEQTLTSDLLYNTFGVEGNVCQTSWQQTHIQYRYNNVSC